VNESTEGPEVDGEKRWQFVLDDKLRRDDDWVTRFALCGESSCWPPLRQETDCPNRAGARVGEGDREEGEEQEQEAMTGEASLRLRRHGRSESPPLPIAHEPRLHT